MPFAGPGLGVTLPGSLVPGVVAEPLPPVLSSSSPGVGAGSSGPGVGVGSSMPGVGSGSTASHSAV